MATENIKIEGAKIRFRNFSGKAGKYNPAGSRNFVVFLPEDIAAELAEEGWNIKYLQPRDEDEDPQAYLQVAVSYAHIPPKIYLVSGGVPTLLKEDEISALDWAELTDVKLVIRPYHYEVNGRTGIKAYVKIMYATIEEDPFASMFKDAPDSAISSLVGDNG